jgi:hypothetical protein
LVQTRHGLCWLTDADALLTVLGRTGHHPTDRRFGITPHDRLGHLGRWGKTGTGQSTLLTHLMAQDLRARRGFMLIDPPGDLVETVLDRVPPARVHDTSSFHPAAVAYPLAFNPLAAIPGLAAHLHASGLLTVLKQAGPEFWGPRLAYVLHTSLLTLVSLPGTTLLDLHRLLSDPALRQRLVSRLTDPQLLQF